MHSHVVVITSINVGANGKYSTIKKKIIKQVKNLIMHIHLAIKTVSVI